MTVPPWTALGHTAAVVVLGAHETARPASPVRERVLLGNSTNVDNMRAGRRHTLVTGALFTEEPPGAGFAGVLAAVLAR